MLVFSEIIIRKLAGLTALRPKQHCITYLNADEMTCRTRQESSLDSRYNAEKSTMIQFSETIIHTLPELSAF